MLASYRNILVGGFVIALTLSIAFSGGVMAATWIEVELEVIPQTCGPSSLVGIQGTSLIDGDSGTPVKGGDVGIRINNTIGYLDEYNISTDASGHYTITITAPSTPGNYTVNVTVVKSTLFGWNQSTLTVLTPRPDLAFNGNITFSNPSPKEGEVVTISCNIENIGKVWCQANISFYDGNPVPKGQLIDVENFSLAAWENTTVSASWTTTPGIHNIYAIIYGCVPEESNLSNNNITASIDVADTTPPSISSVYLNPPAPTSKDNVTIFALVEDNLGIAKQDGILMRYSIGANAPVNINMTATGSDLYSAHIGINPAETIVTYAITATDQYGNINRSDDHTFTVDFYEICLQLADSSNEYEVESFAWVNGTAMLDGYHPVKHADVMVTTDADIGHWTSLTDIEGNFAVRITAPGTEGIHTITAAVTARGLHNTTSMDITVLEGLPDMQITIDDVSLSPSVPEEGKLLTLTVNVTNRGQIDSWATVYLYNGNPETGGVSVDSMDTFVNAGGSNTTTLKWMAESGTESLWIIVSSNITERNLGNNAVEKPIAVSLAPSFDDNIVALLLLTNMISLIIIVILLLLMNKRKFVTEKNEVGDENEK